jgi:ferritin-like metal-binding protein YciE
MSAEELRMLFLSQLDDLYTLERLTLVEKRRFLAVSKDRSVSQAIERGMEEARECKRRIEVILADMGVNPATKTYPVFERMIQDSLSAPLKYGDENVQDTALISMIQRMLRFEIAIYGTLIDLAKQLGLVEAVSQLKQSVREKCSLETDLHRIAVGGFFLPGLNQRVSENKLALQGAY